MVSESLIGSIQPHFQWLQKRYRSFCTEVSLKVILYLRDTRSQVDLGGMGGTLQGVVPLPGLAALSTFPLPLILGAPSGHSGSAHAATAWLGASLRLPRFFLQMNLVFGASACIFLFLVFIITNGLCSLFFVSYSQITGCLSALCSLMRAF